MKTDRVCAALLIFFGVFNWGLKPIVWWVAILTGGKPFLADDFPSVDAAIMSLHIWLGVMWWRVSHVFRV